jgi:hypothetical protein
MSDNELLAAGPGVEQHLYDLRAVTDMVNLHLEAAGNVPAQGWAVLRITPDQYSGSATFIGGAIDGSTGKLIEAATGRPAAPGSLQLGIVEKGSWQALTRIGSPRGKQGGRYDWTKLLIDNKPKIEPEDIYQAFAKGGVILCKHDPQVEGAAQFDSVSLLPQGWESFVRPAIAAVRKNNALFGAPASVSRKDALRAMLQDKNSIVSTIAFRSLAESGALDAEILHEGHTKSTGYRRAVFMYIALLNSRTVGEPVVEQELRQSIQNTRRGPDSRPVALALAAATLFHPDLPRTRSLSLRLLGAVRSQSLRLPRKQAPDSYVERLLKVVPVP